MFRPFFRFTILILLTMCLLIGATKWLSKAISGDAFLYLTQLNDDERNAVIYAFDMRTGVTQIILKEPDVLDFTASPDGQLLLYSKRENKATSFYLSELSSRKTRSLVSGNIDSPRWSPDGQWIAYRQNRPETGLYVISPDGFQARRITEKLYGIFLWAADSQNLIYAERLESNWGIFTVSIAGEPAELLQIFNNPLISLDGVHEALSKQLDSIPQQFNFDAEKQETISDMVFFGELIWSPEGERLAFIAVSRDLSDWGLSIYSAEGDLLALYQPTGLTLSSSLVWWLSG